MTLSPNRFSVLADLAFCLPVCLTLYLASSSSAAAATQDPSAPSSTTVSVAAQRPTSPTASPSPVERGLPLRLVAGKSTLLTLPHDIVRVSVGNPDVADVVLTHPREVYILGKKSGQTNLMLWGKGSVTRLHDIAVNTDIETLKAKLTEWVPGIDQLKIESLGEHLLISGLAQDAVKVQRAMHMAEAFGGEKKVINLLRVGSAQQVMLEVKVAEVSRNLLDELGVDLTMTRVTGSNTLQMLTKLVTTAVGTGTNQSPGGSIRVTRGSSDKEGTLTARMDKDLVKILAEPTITSIHGQEGSFLAGGRIYIPVPQTSSSGATTITLEEKEFGVGLRFFPTVLEDGLINLRVTPEVSELSQEGTLIRGANNITSLLPAITTRRASTTVQLRDGESFVIGGLIKSNVTEAIKAFPVLGELPIIGALFRSTSFQTQKSELLFVVTPHLARPMASAPKLPTDGFVPPSRSELFLEGRMEGRPPQSPEPTATPSTAPISQP
jgi:pilus assembly protein CpaC